MAELSEATAAQLHQEDSDIKREENCASLSFALHFSGLKARLKSRIKCDNRSAVNSGRNRVFNGGCERGPQRGAPPQGLNTGGGGVYPPRTREQLINSWIQRFRVCSWVQRSIYHPVPFVGLKCLFWPGPITELHRRAADSKTLNLCSFWRHKFILTLFVVNLTCFS